MYGERPSAAAFMPPSPSGPSAPVTCWSRAPATAETRSKGLQLLNAQALTSGHGRIVAEFFDVGHTRVLPWTRRPNAAALVAALADPDRGFDAIVIGSSERAFYGQQFATIAPLFAHYGIPVWLPELGGQGRTAPEPRPRPPRRERNVASRRGEAPGIGLAAV